MTSPTRTPRPLLPLAFFAAAALTAGTAALVACSTEDPASPADDAGSSSSSGGSSGASSSSGASGSSSSSSSSSSSGSSGGADAGDAGDAAPACPAVTPPPADGGEACGAFPFGQAAAAATGVVDDAGAYLGGSLVPGIYDATGFERGSGSGGSWRETFVVYPGNRFTRTRQLTTTGAGPITHRSGSYVLKGTEIEFSYDCAVSNGNAVDAGKDTLPFETRGPVCEPTDMRYGASGFRITLKRRP